MVRWNAVSKQATCGSDGSSSRRRRMGPRLCGWCSGASGTNVCSRARTASSIGTGPAKTVPPCTTRCATPASAPSPSAPRTYSRRNLSAPAWSRYARSGQLRSATTAPSGARATNRGAPRAAIDSSWPRTPGTSTPPLSPKSENLIDDDPALRTRMRSAISPRHPGGSFRPRLSAVQGACWVAIPRPLAALAQPLDPLARRGFRRGGPSSPCPAIPGRLDPISTRPELREAT